MSTDEQYPSALTAAVTDGNLIPLNAQLNWKQQKCRRIYLSPTSVNWAKNVLPIAKADGFINGAVTPKEQLLILSRSFCAGEEMQPPIPHLMRPNNDGVWRLRTADLRIIGWFPMQGAFIISEIELKSLCTKLRDEELLEAAKVLRKKLSVDNPKFTWRKINDCL